MLHAAYSIGRSESLRRDNVLAAGTLVNAIVASLDVVRVAPNADKTVRDAATARNTVQDNALREYRNVFGCVPPNRHRKIGGANSGADIIDFADPPVVVGRNAASKIMSQYATSVSKYAFGEIAAHALDTAKIGTQNAKGPADPLPIGSWQCQYNERLIANLPLILSLANVNSFKKRPLLATAHLATTVLEVRDHITHEFNTLEYHTDAALFAAVNTAADLVPKEANDIADSLLRAALAMTSGIDMESFTKSIFACDAIHTNKVATGFNVFDYTVPDSGKEFQALVDCFDKAVSVFY
jgi:hypothetical protein